MGSTACVKCGAPLMPHSYCNVCQGVLGFICSSCSSYTDERIHTHCRDDGIQNSNNTQVTQIPNSSQIVLDDRYDYMQKHLSDEIKFNSINFMTSNWNNMFESIKLINQYWRGIFNIGNPSSSITWHIFVPANYFLRYFKDLKQATQSASSRVIK